LTFIYKADPVRGAEGARFGSDRGDGNVTAQRTAFTPDMDGTSSTTDVAKVVINTL
jgi:hypothetical protein